MKAKSVRWFLSMAVAVSMLAAPAGVWAEDAAESTQQEAAADAEEDTAKEDTAEDFTISSGDAEVTVENQTTQTIKETRLEEAVKEDTEAADEAEDTSKDEQTESTTNLILTEEDGTEHTFEGVKIEEWTEPVLVNSYEFLYIQYKDADGKEQEAAETADERTFDTPITMYASSDVHIREEADKEAKSLKVASLGEEFTVTAAAPGWFKVESQDIKGYVFHNYLTEDKDAVDALVKAKQEAEAAAAAAQQAAAAQAAADAAAAAQAQQEAEAAASQSTEKTEVSRQAYDDCDGSGHGYYEITWSDGSVSYEDY